MAAIKRILITGGLGFIGQHLSQLLESRGYEVTILDRTGGEGTASNSKDGGRIIHAELTSNLPSGLTTKFDAVFHLANVLNINEIIKNPTHAIRNNLESTLYLLEDIRLHNPQCLLVFSSSEKAYGRPAFSMVKEIERPSPVDPYGASKLMCEIAIQSYSHTYGIQYVIIRSGNVFGPGQSPALFIPSVMSRIGRGEKEILVGSLEARRNFVYVEDLCQAYLKCLEKRDGQGQIFNVCAYSKSMQEVADTIKEIAEKHGKTGISYVRDESRVRSSSLEANFQMNCELANELLGWEPEVSFNEALAKTFLHYAKLNAGVAHVKAEEK
ncbi:MAG TPA: NAD(P)-dependent oxidoreductase [Candidatus Nanoarchaeia archaeon]|nr:NAD(P)-dependent oxidoreductase [Candidatus Nanoarchaeia archaeon]